MNLSLSEGGRPASVKNRAWHYCQMAWRGVCTPKALSRLAAFSPLLLLGMGQMAHATDLLAGGKNDVKATFGADSFVIMCIYIAEIVIGVATYIRTKNLLILLGLVVVIVFCQRQDYWPFFAIFNVRYWSLMLSAFRHFIITDWRGVFCQHSRFAFFL